MSKIDVEHAPQTNGPTLLIVTIGNATAALTQGEALQFSKTYAEELARVLQIEGRRYADNSVLRNLEEAAWRR